MVSRIALITLFSVLSIACNEGDAKKEKQNLQGKWQAVAIEADGKKGPEDLVARMTIIFSDDTFTLDIGVKTKGTFLLDLANTPKTIDFAFSKDVVAKGIYILDGDSLKICYAQPGKERPKELTTESGSGHELFVLKRTK